jgi:hypothetical protein
MFVLLVFGLRYEIFNPPHPKFHQAHFLCSYPTVFALSSIQHDTHFLKVRCSGNAGTIELFWDLHAEMESCVRGGVVQVCG